MIESILEAIQTLSQRIAVQESRPYNPYLPDADLFDHFAGDGTLDARWTATTAGTGTVTLPNATPTVARLDTAATANSVAEINWGSRFPLVGANNYVSLIARFAFTTAAVATGVATARFITGAGDNVQIGFRGPDSMGFFVCRSSFGGVTLTVTTVPVDTAMHLFGIYMFPDRVRYYIDNALVAEHTANVPTAAVQPRLTANNGASGGAQTMDADLIWVREAR